HLRRPRAGWALGGVALLAFAAPTPAQAQAAAEAPAAPAPPPCGRGRSAAISELACELALALATTPVGALVVGAPLVAPGALRQPDELSRRIAANLAGRLGRGARAADEVADLTRARALASAAGTLVHLGVTLEGGEVRVVADVYPVPARFWDRVRDPRPSPVLHAFASRRLDPEIRSFLPPVPLVANRVDRADLPESPVVSLACDDLDLDGASELVLVGRHALVVGRVRRGELERSASVELSGLSPVAQSPLREPIGSVAVTPGSHLDVGTSDRAFMMRLDGVLRLTEHPGRRLPWPAGGCSRFAGPVLASPIERCVATDPAPTLDDFGWGTDAIAGAVLLDRAGRLRSIYAGRRGDASEVVLRDGDRRSARIAEAGAQLAVSDLDGDGEPEILASLDTLDPAGDAIVVRTWRGDGSVEERLRVPVPEGVRAIGVCPPEGDTMAPIAIATGRSLWIVR
ncbi:MAG TPA: hypothetical protein PLU22_13350, partial [Polyangiaceae bacterium]|nr:hypothetical protein [Polyangiaceae bacterium]